MIEKFIKEVEEQIKITDERFKDRDLFKLYRSEKDPVKRKLIESVTDKTYDALLSLEDELKKLKELQKIYND